MAHPPILLDGIPSPQSDKANEVQRHLIARYKQTEEKTEALSAFKYGLAHPSIADFRKKYPIAGITRETRAELDRHIQENRDKKINRAPYITLNHWVLPEAYDISDLPFLLTDLDLLLAVTAPLDTGYEAHE